MHEAKLFIKAGHVIKNVPRGGCVKVKRAIMKGWALVRNNESTLPGLIVQMRQLLVWPKSDLVLVCMFVTSLWLKYEGLHIKVENFKRFSLKMLPCEAKRFLLVQLHDK